MNKRDESMQRDDEILLQRRGTGFAFEGPGYYFWDEDPREVLRAAAELPGACPPPGPTRQRRVRPPASQELPRR
ncbi:MAG: hypothetical protein GY723_12285 [bacterium]|nr:hypothetical protein [bacterium]